ncbi:hypothetical protein ADIS_4292 [Lunatimonas lonarensis]|uniref:Uncharacterized protein n=1 Tax=Lunatimonas lonarensis TaxID=1232681 RepID=R7ZM00_9BACT|nr:hypothetical protein ADIS_4292 [Lunatimonas lonarensis]
MHCFFAPLLNAFAYTIEFDHGSAPIDFRGMIPLHILF